MNGLTIKGILGTKISNEESSCFKKVLITDNFFKKNEPNKIVIRNLTVIMPLYFLCQNVSN